MKTRQAKDGWTATFGDPVSWLLLALIGDWRWITPNGLTILSLAIRLTAAFSPATGWGGVVWPVVLAVKTVQRFKQRIQSLARLT